MASYIRLRVFARTPSLLPRPNWQTTGLFSSQPPSSSTSPSSGLSNPSSTPTSDSSSAPPTPTTELSSPPSTSPETAPPHEFRAIPGWSHLEPISPLSTLPSPSIGDAAKRTAHPRKRLASSPPVRKSKNAEKRLARLNAWKAKQAEEEAKKDVKKTEKHSGETTSNDWAFVADPSVAPPTRPVRPSRWIVTDKSPEWVKQKAAIAKKLASFEQTSWNPTVKVNTSQLLEIRKRHAEDPKTWNLKTLAAEYKIDVQAVKKIVRPAPAWREGKLAGKLAEGVEKAEKLTKEQWMALKKEELELDQKLDESDPFGDLEAEEASEHFGKVDRAPFVKTPPVPHVPLTPAQMQERWEEEYEALRHRNRLGKEREEAEARAREELWGWKSGGSSKDKKVGRRKKGERAEAEEETEAPEPTSSTGFNWAQALHHHTK